MKQNKKEYLVLTDQSLLKKFFRFFCMKLKDIKNKEERNRFREYGLSIYAGMQGDGKTMSLVERLEFIRKNYPDVLICTNFGYIHEDVALTDWKQLLELRHEKGIVFAIDEIQNEFSVYEAKKFNTNILSVVTQQRKQSIKIYATSQHFTRVSKPLREQTFEVIECKTISGRWTFQRCYDAQEYEATVQRPEARSKLRRKWRRNFVQSDEIRDLYNSYALIDNMLQLENDSR